MAKAVARNPQLPAFAKDEAERAFWDTLDVGDYLTSSRAVQGQVSGHLRERVRERKRNLTTRTGA